MKRFQYKCTLLSDVVITSNSATDGFHQSLDYIPGSKFLGIVAGALYDENKANQTLDLFHNGTVRFGDAHPLINKTRLLKIPFAWNFKKGEEGEGEVYLSHNLSPEDKSRLRKNGIQLKQERGKYFSSNRALTSPQNFSIKSAYDTASRKSKEGQMYGYYGLSKGTEWGFSIDINSENSGTVATYRELIDESLKGEKRIGRSKSAEYGLVKIEFVNELEISKSSPIRSEVNYLYAESNLCFYNSEGTNTTQPKTLDLDISSGEILWGKSQIRTKSYRTWNRHRRSRNTDWLIIEKGSVIAIKDLSQSDADILAKGIGAHRAEGFGNVLLNPSFLISDKMTLPLEQQIKNIKREDFIKSFDESIVQSGNDDELIKGFLKRRNTKEKKEDKFTKEINEFIFNEGERFKKISNSQWSQIRKYAKVSTNSYVLKKLLFDESVGFCFRGQSESDWRQKGRRKKLLNFLFESERKEKEINEFTIKLCAEMSKRSKN